ncbi:type II toxin-antitoxin system RelE/ParE family toxin [Candidatus Microgenomates bacterium]|nr:type II toxin-antitoxin system RelE/ParE family toxin [Candidatus Microgenomates bacterium]
MRVFFTKEACKHFSNLSTTEQLKIKKRAAVLESYPLAGKKLSGKFVGQRALRAWPYRIIYYIDNVHKEVWVTSIVHRQGAYK